MGMFILLAVLSVAPKAPALPAPTSGSEAAPKSSTDIGSYTVKTGQITPEALKASFKHHLKLQNAEYQKPWKDFGGLKDRITWQTLTRYQPEWRYTGPDNTTWVYQAPDFGNDWPSKALQIADKSDSSGYKLDVTVYCTGNETECATYVAAQKSMLAPRPNGIQTDMAYKQWRNRIKQEACVVRPANLSHPRYPPMALRDGISGTVRVGFIFNSCGNVRDAWIATSSRNRDLDRAALTEALKWQIDTTTLPEGKNTGMAIAPVVFSAE